MTHTAWKQEERQAAVLIGGTRYPANQGGRIDVEGPQIVGQVKLVKRLSLAELEALAEELETIGHQRSKLGVVVVKRRAGQGIQTPRLVVMTQPVFEALVRELTGKAGNRDEAA